MSEIFDEYFEKYVQAKAEREAFERDRELPDDHTPEELREWVLGYYEPFARESDALLVLKELIRQGHGPGSN
jgi:AcrR family transcriptional regulator